MVLHFSVHFFNFLSGFTNTIGGKNTRFLINNKIFDDIFFANGHSMPAAADMSGSMGQTQLNKTDGRSVAVEMDGRCFLEICKNFTQINFVNKKIIFTFVADLRTCYEKKNKRNSDYPFRGLYPRSAGRRYLLFTGQPLRSNRE